MAGKKKMNQPTKNWNIYHKKDFFIFLDSSCVRFNETGGEILFLLMRLPPPQSTTP